MRFPRRNPCRHASVSRANWRLPNEASGGFFLDFDMRYFRTIGTALTELLGAFTGITINSNETTSGAAFRRNPDGWLRKTIDRLFFWQSAHCEMAVRAEIEDCKELLLAYGFDVTPPPVSKAQAVKQVKKAKLWKEQAPAREQEQTDDDPMSDEFDAVAWFGGLPDDAKARIVEWGVSIKMSRSNRKKVAQIAQKWWTEGAVAREGHGL